MHLTRADRVRRRQPGAHREASRRCFRGGAFSGLSDREHQDEMVGGWTTALLRRQSDDVVVVLVVVLPAENALWDQAGEPGLGWAFRCANSDVKTTGYGCTGRTSLIISGPQPVASTPVAPNLERRLRPSQAAFSAFGPRGVRGLSPDAVGDRLRPLRQVEQLLGRGAAARAVREGECEGERERGARGTERRGRIAPALADAWRGRSEERSRERTTAPGICRREMRER